MNSWKNKLYYGDNLNILREYIASDSVDLIYLDPPFNSNRSYNVLFKDESGQDSAAQLTAFEDTWHWDRIAEETYHELVAKAPPQIAMMIGAFREFIGTNPMMAYLVMMTIRLLELHRVLKITGSLYLHCDPTASHYLKIVLDTIFGREHFINEINWKRTTTKSDYLQGAKNWPRIHDVLLYYAKDTNRLVTFKQPFAEYSKEYLKKFYKYQDTDGRCYTLGDLAAPGAGSRGHPQYEFMGITRYWRYGKEKMEQLLQEGRIIQKKPGTVPRYKRYLDEVQGVPIGDIWTDIGMLQGSSRERLGYPTQKPVALLERIVDASSNKGDLVLDPFCGCGTTIHAAQKLNRRWIGIDITHLAASLLKYRLKDAFELVEDQDYQVIGEPKDLAGARQLAQENRYEFQWWALSLIQAQPLGGEIGSKQGKKGKDRGIDGVITFLDDPKKKPKKLVVQVKSGKVKSGDIRDLGGTVDREQAAIGVFLTLEPPTKDMQKEALSAGFYHSAGWNKDFPKIQILTIEDLLTGVTVQMPPTAMTYKKAQREQEPDAEQVTLL
jgi:site-specific DNA-methyltransferase (adenine-specific)